MQLKLYTPKLEQALQQTPETRTNVIAARLEEISGAHPEIAAKEVVAALGRLNRAEISESVRIKLNQLYEPFVLKQIEALVATLPENGTPQSNADRQVATLIYELALELTYAWKLAYLGLDMRRSLFGGGQARQNALRNLLIALADLISVSYRTYTSPPSQSWLELHQVHNALQRENSGEEDDPENAAAVSAYKRILLLALADPFRLTRTEMDITLAYLKKFSGLSELTTGNKHKNSSFCIDINADSPYCQNDDPDQSQALVLDTRAVCKHLRSLIVKLKTGEAFRDIGLSEVPKGFDGLSLLSRLHQSWRGNWKRGFNRYVPELAHADVICGIPAIHRLFDPRQKPVSDGAKQANSKKSSLELSDQSLPARWRVLNDSASGLSISAHAQEVAQVRLGNLIAFRMESDNAAAWALGVIRWGKMSKGQMVSAGVEKLAPNASSVVLRLLQGTFTNIGQPAMLIPSNPKLQIDEHLVLPHGLYKRGYQADMWHNGQSRRIAFGSLVEQTPFFDLVELEPA